MKYLAIEIRNESNSTIQSQLLLKKETLKVLELYEKDVIREIYFDEHHCAVLVLECNGLREAEEAINQLPLVASGLIKFKIKELKPYTGFTRLIE